jgi:DNA-binding NarL/FixJ family response regulator
MNAPIRVMLIEDHELVRTGFRMLIESQPDMVIVAEAGSGEEGLARLESLSQPPDVILVDISMPGMGGIEFTRRLKRAFPQVAILAVTVHDSQAYLLQMIDAGAEGFLPKHAAANDLLQAIRAVHGGQKYVHPSMIEALVEGYRGKGRGRAGPEVLTDRQKQVLRLIAQGKTSGQVGQELGLSPRTVDRHIENIMKKLGVRSRLELVRFAVESGLVQEEGD